MITIILIGLAYYIGYNRGLIKGADNLINKL